ncbi:Crp/Fnr family transcriptional regulator [Aquimarina hainanensis]|uniref:Crp/Fnr family transcriptional regulator n=1 Tax=Aquimarina hainanensis TaxID=1578017 RepID=A0ABW5N7Z8_9FLAO|nr:Crp/Fnr family transcriptional regulator [Aquimarina sp. TRL1]QKX04739.1 Crp/Fnr family transcriptional regulator [Aquimarina sp. TRL1]
MEHIVKGIFGHLVTLSDSEWKEVSSHFKLKKYPNKSYLLREGQIANETFFIIKGCCRAFHNFDGKEKNICFSRENCWETDVDSFFNNKPSATYIQAIEDMTVLSLTLDNKLRLFKYHQRFERYFRILAEQMITYLLDVLIKRDTLCAEKRFLALKKRQAWVFQRIPQYHIASFLGISATSFSLIQKDLLLKNSV